MRTRPPSEFWLCYRPFDDDSIPTALVDRARAAVVVDTAARARAAGFERVRIFSTVDLAEQEWLHGRDALVGAELVRTAARQSIGGIVSKAATGAPGAVCYAGSGMPAMTVEDWSLVLERIRSGVATANRVFSCDWLGVPDGRLLASVARERVDNRFAQRVRANSETEFESSPRSARSLLDVDTPADLIVLKTVARVNSLDLGESLRAELNGQRELDDGVRKAVKVFETMTRPTKQLFVTGRVSGSDWAVVDRDTSCRVRVLSEERGLRTRGGQAQSWLASMYEQSGQQRFVETLTSMGDAVIWDTRPFLAHLGRGLSRADRFAADMGLWTLIEDEWLRELTLDLWEAPVLTGGHSLVSGGLLAAIDAAWTRRELSG